MRVNMKNPCKTIDGYVTKGIQYILKSYNWVTGGDKYDFARNLSMITPAVFLGSGLVKENEKGIFAGCVLSSAALLHTMVNHKLLQLTKEREEESQKQEILDLELELQKNTYKKVGYFNVILGILTYAVDAYGMEGLTVLGLEQFVLSLDENVPRRKHVFARAKEKLADIIQSYKAQPTM